MADSKIFMIPDGYNGGANHSSLDPNLLLAMMNNGGGFGANGGGFLWMLFLFFLYPLMNGGWFGNGGFGGFGGNHGGGFGTGFLSNQINDTAGRDLLMQAINSKGDAINQLASRFGTTSDIILQAINGINSAICRTESAVNMTGTQIISAIKDGNYALASQLSSCCCDVREAITRGNYENQLATVNQTNTLSQIINGVNTTVERGFAASSFETAQQTCAINQNIQAQTQTLKDAAVGNTRAILDKLDAMENRAKDARIAALETQLTTEHQSNVIAQNIAAATSPLMAGINGLQREVDAIKCKQPDTVTTPYQPFVAVPNCVAAQYGLGFSGFGVGNGFWF